MKYFFDTNIISDFARKKEETINKVQELASKEESEFYINRLVYLESLRAIPSSYKKLYNDVKETLDSFIKLDITQEIYDVSVEFSRFCRSNGVNLGKCEAIDYLHFITAKHYELAIISDDGDMEVLETQYITFQEENV